MKTLPILSIILSLACLAHAQNAPQTGAVTPPTVANPDITVVPARPTGAKIDPEQQVAGFYRKCAQGAAGDGLRDLLKTNPVVKEDDVKRVSDAFSEMVKTMGAFVDFELIRGRNFGKRTQVLRCVAHFERQPFVNEFTFYDPGDGDWRLVHLRYDANLATMFLEDLQRDAAPQSGR